MLRIQDSNWQVSESKQRNLWNSEEASIQLKMARVLIAVVLALAVLEALFQTAHCNNNTTISSTPSTHNGTNATKDHGNPKDNASSYQASFGAVAGIVLFIAAFGRIVQ